MSTQLSQVLAVVSEAPATSAEVAAKVGLSAQLSRFYLHEMWEIGVLTRRVYDPGVGRRRRGTMPYLYELARRAPS